MEATLIDRKVRTISRQTFSHPIKQSETVTYEILQKRKREQQWLIAMGIIEKPKIADDVFTPKQEREFNKGITLDNIFRKYNIQ